MMHRRAAVLAASTGLAALLLSGCAGAQEAIDQAQGVVDDAQSLVDTATTVAGAPQAIEQACRTALAGLAPGTPADTAEAALTEATAEMDAALGIAGSLPIVSQLRDVLVASVQSVVVDGTEASLASAREAVTGVCDIASPAE